MTLLYPEGLFDKLSFFKRDTVLVAIGGAALAIGGASATGAGSFGVDAAAFASDAPILDPDTEPSAEPSSVLWRRG